MTKDFAKPSTTRTTSHKGGIKQKAKQKKSNSTGSKKNASQTASKPKGASPKPLPKEKKPFFQTLSMQKIQLFLKLAALTTVLGLAAWGILLLNQVPPTDSSQDLPQTTSTKETSNKAEAKQQQTAKENAKKPQFEFYNILPKSRVTPSEDNISAYKPKSEDGSPYLRVLQTGSFRHKKDAEAQRAKIALLGIKSSIKEIQLKNGNIWYRVETTPFTSRSRLNGAIDKLVTINIQPIERKVKP